MGSIYLAYHTKYFIILREGKRLVQIKFVGTTPLYMYNLFLRGRFFNCGSLSTNFLHDEVFLPFCPFLVEVETFPMILYLLHLLFLQNNKAFFIIDWFMDPPTLLFGKLKKNKIGNPYILFPPLLIFILIMYRKN